MYSGRMSKLSNVRGFCRMVYLDNSATTPVCREAADKALYMMTDCFGNPSSLHSAGLAAEREREAARAAVAALIGASAENLVFTSGGTEANNLAILGGAAARRRRGRHVVTTAVEHPSVSTAFDALAEQGFEVTRLSPDPDGGLSVERLAAACRADTVLVSVMTVNNETGARFPVEEMAAAVRRVSPEALFHTDAVQAAGKLPLRVSRTEIDLLSLSGHKLHAPKGSGALYIRKGVRLLPRQLGGGQERGLRSGTEAMPAIAAFGAAAAAALPPERLLAHCEALRQRLLTGLAGLPEVRMHLPAMGVPYIVNISLPGIRSETMLHFLAQRDIFVSSGSACAKGAQSPVLRAMGLPAAEIDSALRISFGRYNTEEDIDRFLEAFRDAARTLTRAGGFRRPVR